MNMPCSYESQRNSYGEVYTCGSPASHLACVNDASQFVCLNHVGALIQRLLITAHPANASIRLADAQ